MCTYFAPFNNNGFVCLGFLCSDDNRTAQHLYNTIRVLCYVPVPDQGLYHKAIHVHRTWGRHCNKLIFFAEHNPADKRLGLPVIGLGIQNTSKLNLTHKMFAGMQYLYDHNGNDYDWFIKADTDTYVIVENLRYLLSAYKPTQQLYFGHHFKVGVALCFFICV